MKKFFSAYPRFTFQLAGIYFLEQLCYFHAYSTRINLFAAEGFPSIDVASFPYNLLTEGGAMILGGWWADRMSNKRHVLLIGLALILLGLVSFLIEYHTTSTSY